MAVTITRSIWIDDDGTGTTGTVINQALHTTLYNEIDTALAKVAQLAGGNTFTGNQTISGVLAVAGFGNHAFSAGGTGPNLLTVTNTAAGAVNYAAVVLGNDTIPQVFWAQAFSSTWATSGAYIASGVALRGMGPGGVSLTAEHASGALRVYTGGAAERMRITPAGEVFINGTASAGNGQLFVAADSSVHNGVSIQNTNPSNVQNMIAFMNSAGGVCGLIVQSGATTVVYQTTSDARLKTDLGRATDVAGLRAVVVHDFTWTADGVRDRGVFAQEAHRVFPRAIGTGTDETTDEGTLTHPWMTDYSKFVPDLIVGWQQHDAEIAELRAMFAAVKG